MHCLHCFLRIVLSRSMVVALAAVVCPSAWAQSPAPATGLIPIPKAVSAPNGNLMVVPQQRSGSRQTGLWLFVDTRWVNGYGYRPVKVTVWSPKPTTAGHTITVQLHCGWQRDVSAAQSISLPIGSTRASTNVSIPIYDQNASCFWWNVWVDGVKDIDLSLKKEDALGRWGLTNFSSSNLKLLVPGDNSSFRTFSSSNSMDFDVLSLEPTDFPQRWINYSCFDVVSLSTAELQSIAQTNPTAFEAMARWVRAGGQLWVTEVGADLSQLPQVSKLLHLSDVVLDADEDETEKVTTDKNGGKSEGAATNQVAKVGWLPAQFRRRFRAGQARGFTDKRSGQTRWVADPKVIAELERDPNYVRADRPWSTSTETSPRWRVSDSSQWFVEQQLGLGRVRAFRGTNEVVMFAQNKLGSSANAASGGASSGPFPPTLAMGLRSTRHWDSRHGLTPDSGNPEFAKLLVPGVGLAPVTEFQVLITLFVLAIGPLNYWILKRYKRLQLLVLTVPLSAIVATVALFAYAIVSDGFATRVRVRSFTLLDQRTGEAACWSRLSYYSGMAPGRGLTMPADVVMYPILPEWGNESWGNYREMVWSGEKEQLARGWLNSRTPTQYLALRSRKTPCRIDVTAGNGKMRVTNRLGTRIESLIAIDRSGKFFAGEQLANESRQTLKRISRDDAVKRVVELVRKYEPEVPPALAGSDPGYMGRRGRSGRPIYAPYGPQNGSEQLAGNLADRALSDLAGLDGQPALDLPPRSYVAFTTTGPEVETGISYAREVASFHVILGQW
ncbi:MAG TPA: hypothetical protein VHE81_17565 [Lacipirellulaceae bacterium]|nr:hypothetical protein [Lacipirellulaceae bacterium]